MAPPVTRTAVKKTEAADAAQQRREKVAVMTGFVPPQIKAVRGDGCPKKGLH